MSDRLSELPDCVLLHIMEFMNAKIAVQTCVLSKRWKHLWKRLTVLTLHSSDFFRGPSFSNFVSSVLSGRDESISLHNLDLWREDRIGTNLLNRVMTYAATHHIQQLSIRVSLYVDKDFGSLCLKIKLPKSLELPTLKNLHLQNVIFATTDNGCAEPFSKCHMLNTLVIEHCYLKRDAKILCVSNSKLSNLTVISYSGWGKAYEIMLSTPNLNLLTLDGDPLLEPTSTCNISCLEEVNINVQKDFLMRFILISWLQVLANVKMMTLSRSTFEILNDLLSHGSMRSLLPCFVRLKSLKLDSDIPDQKVSRVVEYLLQNSPLTRVDIIKYLCCFAHTMGHVAAMVILCSII